MGSLLSLGPVTPISTFRPSTLAPFRRRMEGSRHLLSTYRDGADSGCLPLWSFFNHHAHLTGGTTKSPSRQSVSARLLTPSKSQRPLSCPSSSPTRALSAPAFKKGSENSHLHLNAKGSVGHRWPKSGRKGLGGCPEGTHAKQVPRVDSHPETSTGRPLTELVHSKAPYVVSCM